MSFRALGVYLMCLGMVLSAAFAAPVGLIACFVGGLVIASKR